MLPRVNSDFFTYATVSQDYCKPLSHFKTLKRQFKSVNHYEM